MKRLPGRMGTLCVGLGVFSLLVHYSMADPSCKHVYSYPNVCTGADYDTCEGHTYVDTSGTPNVCTSKSKEEWNPNGITYKSHWNGGSMKFQYYYPVLCKRKWVCAGSFYWHHFPVENDPPDDPDTCEPGPPTHCSACSLSYPTTTPYNNSSLLACDIES